MPVFNQFLHTLTNQWQSKVEKFQEFFVNFFKAWCTKYQFDEVNMSFKLHLKIIIEISGFFANFSTLLGGLDVRLIGFFFHETFCKA